MREVGVSSTSPSDEVKSREVGGGKREVGVPFTSLNYPRTALAARTAQTELTGRTARNA
jgi:hypothetical protein